MTRLALIAAVAAFALAGCDTAMVDNSARAAAKSVVQPIVAETVPGPAGVLLTDCIIDNASADELVRIAGAAATGVTPATVQLVSNILGRPETVTCATSGLTGGVL